MQFTHVPQQPPPSRCFINVHWGLIGAWANWPQWHRLHKVTGSQDRSVRASKINVLWILKCVQNQHWPVYSKNTKASITTTHRHRIYMSTCVIYLGGNCVIVTVKWWFTLLKYMHWTGWHHFYSTGCVPVKLRGKTQLLKSSSFQGSKLCVAISFSGC